VGAVVAANRLIRSGNYVAARAELEGADLLADDQAAMFTIMLLDKMDEQQAKQQVVEQLVEALEPKSHRSDTLLAFLLRQAERACLPVAHIDKVLAATRGHERTQGELGLVFHAVRQRQKFREQEAPRAAGIRFISLGLNCIPWTILNRWGMRDRRQFITEFNPFSLATHEIPAVIAALDNDFATYTLPELIDVDSSHHGQPIARHKDGSVEWNHNQGLYWTSGNFEPLFAKLAMKIDNFRRTCTGDSVVFIISRLGGGAHKVDFLPDLQRALARHTGHENNRILLTGRKAKRRNRGVEHVDEFVSVFANPVPSDDYVWFDMNAADSPEGLEYERSYMRYLFECLQNWGLLRETE